MTADAVAPRSTLTFLFTDIEGSTRQWEECPGMRDRVDRHFAVLRTSVDDAGGTVFATLGDGIAAAFPSAHAAVRAALAAQRLLPSLGLSVRMGLHTGEVDEADGDFRGRPVNRAARVMAAAHGGQVLASDLTASLLRAGTTPVEVIDLGAHRLRDLAEPERLWQVAAADLPRAFPPPRAVDVRSSGLPVPRASLVGRERDVCRVAGALAAHRVVTLTGAGGVGKTRLALEAAADASSRATAVWFVELAAVTVGDDVVDTLARALGVGSAADPWAAARALLDGERTLLVVDNCEHVVDEAAAVVDELTAACPRLAVLATSREPLGIEGEHVLAVRSLEPEAAAGLLRDRVASAGYELCDHDRELVDDICRRLDGIPLAIELAAARVASIGLAAVADALDDRFKLLQGGRRRAVDRHGTMRATIDWSYRLLDDDERRLLRALAVFASGFELDAVEHVAAHLGGDCAGVLAQLSSLVQKSMLHADDTDHGRRYRMLETVRAFVLEELDRRGERAAAVAALADWVASLTDLSWEEPCSAHAERQCRRLEREGDNWREAMLLAGERADGELGARLCGPPAALFLLGRHDLADVVRPLVPVARTLRQRLALVAALMLAAAGTSAPPERAAWIAEVDAAEAGASVGMGAILRWLDALWTGDFVRAVDVCVRAWRDERLPATTRDLLVGVATLDQFCLTETGDDVHGLLPHALQVAQSSDVALHRATCWLGAAWAIAERDPAGALELVRRAGPDIAGSPALTRLTHWGSAARLLSRLDPCLASRGLLELLDAAPPRRSFVDLVPLSYAVEVLHRVGHPAAATLVRFRPSSDRAHVSMMDFLEIAWRAAVDGARPLAEARAVVRAALVDVADRRLAPAGAP